MNKFGKFSFVLIVLGFIGGCSSAEKNGVGDKIEVDELIFAQNPESVRGKLDVYASMARGVKYNVDVAAQEMNKKLFSQNQNMAPQDIIQNMMNVKSGRDNPLCDSLRALDYAVIYAMVNLSGSRSYIDNNIFVKTSQNLALASIKTHKGALFAARQLKEIARLTDKQQKKLSDINKKEERTGRLTPAELSYKKGLEVALLKLKEMYEAQAFAVAEYAHLVKAEPKELKLEGRTFYELDDLDRKLTVRAFQRSAFNNRSEFDIAKEMGRSYRFREVEYNLLKKYPEIERLNINGYDVEDEVYAENLEKRAYALALGLVKKTEAYKKAKAEERDRLRVKAFDELGTAIFTQVEVAYNLVRLSEIDFGVVSKQAADLKKDIKQRERGRLSADAEISLLNDRIKLLALQNEQSQIAAEKALALRALYFYAGFSPFTRTLLKNEIKDIVVSLRASFNKDMVEMLAAVPAEEAYDEKVGNDWAKKENWLEDLMENKPEVPVAQPAVSAGPAVHTGADDIFAPYADPAYDRKKVMQLGSYVERENADLEWKMLQELYPELRVKTPEVIRTRINGQIFYRLVLHSESGGFLSLCNRLRGDRVQCLLR